MPQASMMNVRIIDDAGELDGLAADWHRLWLEQPRKEAFMHHAWAKVFLDVYGTGRGLRCLVAEESEVRGILPLFRDAKGCLRFIGDPRSDYSDVLCHPRDASAVTEVFSRFLRKEKSVALSAVPEHSLLFNALKETRHGLTVTIEEPCPAIEFDADGSVARDLLKKESLRRHEKKVAKLGPIRLHKAATQGEAASLLPLLFDQHISRWKTTGTPSLFENPEHRLFYERLITNDDLWPMIDFRIVHAGERAVATHFGFFHDRRFVWYKPSFDAELSSMGPGEVLLKHLIAAAVAEGAHEFDFTRGGEGFKQRFATVTKNNYLISRRTLAQRLRSAASRVRSKVLKRG